MGATQAGCERLRARFLMSGGRMASGSCLFNPTGFLQRMSHVDAEGSDLACCCGQEWLYPYRSGSDVHLLKRCVDV